MRACRVILLTPSRLTQDDSDQHIVINVTEETDTTIPQTQQSQPRPGSTPAHALPIPVQVIEGVGVLYHHLHTSLLGQFDDSCISLLTKRLRVIFEGETSDSPFLQDTQYTQLSNRKRFLTSTITKEDVRIPGKC